MNGQEAECEANGVLGTPVNNKSRGLAASPTGGAVGPDKDQGGSGPSGAAAEVSIMVDCSNSTELFSIRHSEDRFSLDSDDGTPKCRFCFQGPEEGEMLSPCRCSGSVGCIHQSCLNRWIDQRGVWSCEICHYKYQVSTSSTKNPLKWKAVSMSGLEKGKAVAVLISIMLIIGSFSWFIWSLITPSLEKQRMDYVFRIYYCFFGFFNIIFIGLIICQGPSLLRLFRRWQAVNQRCTVLNYSKDNDSENQRTGTNTQTLGQIPTSYASVTSMTPGAVLVNMPF